MTEPLILCCHAPGVRPTERAPAMRAIIALREWYDLRLVECRGELDYISAVRAAWAEHRVLVNLEHDHAPTHEMIEQLLGCTEPYCVYPYWMSALTTGNVGQAIPSCPPTDRMGYSDQLAIGIIKVGWPRPGMPDGRHWGDVEGAVGAVIGTRRHIHTPVADHYHGFRSQPNQQVKEIQNVGI